MINLPLDVACKINQRIIEYKLFIYSDCRNNPKLIKRFYKHLTDTKRVSKNLFKIEWVVLFSSENFEVIDEILISSGGIIHSIVIINPNTEEIIKERLVYQVDWFN